MTPPKDAAPDGDEGSPSPPPDDRCHRDRSGSALIVAIAVLFVMLVLAVALLNVSTSERASSSAYVDKVRARMLAISGIEELRARRNQLESPDATYSGEDWNANRTNDDLSGASGDAEGTEDENGNGNGRLERTVPPRYALHPSFAETDGNGNPALVKVIEGGKENWRGYTGRLPSSYEGEGSDTYVLKVNRGPRLNVNSLNPNVGRMIDRVYQARVGSAGTRPGSRLIGSFSDVSVERVDRNGNGVYGDTGDERVLRTSRKRPDVVLDLETHEVSGGYQRMSEVRSDLKEIYGNADGKAIFQELQPVLGIHRNLYLDPSVIRPLPQNTEMTFDEDGNCGPEAGPYADCRNEGQRDLRASYPIPDETPGRPKAIRGKIWDDQTDDGGVVVTGASKPDVPPRHYYMRRPTDDTVTDEWDLSSWKPSNWRSLVTPTSDMIHTERMYWMNLVREPFTDYTVGNASLDRSARDDENVVEDVEGRKLGVVRTSGGGEEGYQYGAFRYNFNYRIQPRAPVNVNLADKSLLRGLIEGVRARIIEIPSEASIKATTGLDFTDDGSRFPAAPSTKDANEAENFPMYQTRVLPDPAGGNPGIDPSTAEEIAREIHDYANGNTTIRHRGATDYSGPFRTWPEFEAFVDQIIVDTDNGNWNGGLGLSNDIGYLLKAHFNPNTRAMGKLNGNRAAIWTWISDGQDNPGSEGNHAFIDKGDFLYYTTEFTFLHPHPVRVVSHGRLTGPRGRIRAESTISAVLQTRKVAKHTTQADFEVNSASTTANMLTYPENVENTGVTSGGTSRVRMRQDTREPITGSNELWAYRTGAGLSGQMSVAPKTDIHRLSDPWVEWGYDTPDESTRGISDHGEDAAPFRVWENVDRLWTKDHPHVSWPYYVQFREDHDTRGTVNTHLPYAWTSREFNDVSDDSTPYDAGVLGGKYDPTEDQDGDGTMDYPWNEEKHENRNDYKSKHDYTNADPYEDPTEDPYNYSDVAADGMLMTSDRYRSIRFSTSSSKPPVVEGTLGTNWDPLEVRQGHIEFWWKPRAGTLSGSGDPLSEQRMVFPLWRHWMMQNEDETNIRTLSFTTGNGPDDANSRSTTGTWNLNYQRTGANLHAEDDGGGGLRRDEAKIVRSGTTHNDDRYAYKCSDDAGANTHWDSVIATKPKRHLDTDRGYYTGPQGVKGVGRPALDENQRWSGYDCNYPGFTDGSGNYRVRYRNGQGLGGRIFPDTGCLEAKPAIQAHLQHWDVQLTARFEGQYEQTDESNNLGTIEWAMPDYRIPGRLGLRSSEAEGNPLVSGDYVSFTRFYQQTGDGLGSQEGALGADEKRPHLAYKTGGDPGEESNLGGPNGDKFYLGNTYGWFYRFYFVKEPQSSPRSSRWVFKISSEAFMDMDVGLRALENDYSPPNTARTTVGGNWHFPFGGHDHKSDEDRHRHFDKSRTWETFEPASTVIAVLDLGSSDLTSSQRTKATPRPGKWIHVTLEWENLPIAKYRTGRVGSDGRKTGYPLYVPWDPWEAVNKRIDDTSYSPGNINPGDGSDQGRDMMAGRYIDPEEVADATLEDWLHIYPVPVERGNQPRQFPKILAFETPYINVNGVHETETQLYAGNISGETGKFNPPPFFYANSVCYDEPNDTWKSNDWWYIEHWTYKHFGSMGRLGNNFARRTKRYGPFDNGKPDGPDQIATYEWARYYDDQFLEGTIDEVFWRTPLNGQDPLTNGRYRVNDDPIYEGSFRPSTDPFWDVSGDRDRYNGYAKVDQRVLAGDENKPLRVEKLAHTQYRPVTDSHDKSIPELDRPYFEVRFKTESGAYSFNYTNSETGTDRWYGEPVTPEELTGSRLILSRGESLDYKVEPTYPRSLNNITPFLEDVTVMYENNQNIYLKMSYR